MAGYQKRKRLDKLTREEKIELMFDLINAFSIVESPTETAFFLQDLLTATEIKNLAKRLRIAKLLLENLTQREIAKKVSVSPATVNKVNLWLARGGEGFKKVIEKLPAKWDIPKDLPRGPIEFHLPQTLLTVVQHSVAKSQDKKSRGSWLEWMKRARLTEAIGK
ncbi:trp operon repressor [Patescibacteria group bacterium]|nr:trp operon repressor [Patescibacteria group bacterium]